MGLGIDRDLSLVDFAVLRFGGEGNFSHLVFSLIYVKLVSNSHSSTYNHFSSTSRDTYMYSTKCSASKYYGLPNPAV